MVLLNNTIHSLTQESNSKPHDHELATLTTEPYITLNQPVIQPCGFRFNLTAGHFDQFFFNYSSIFNALCMNFVDRNCMKTDH